LSTCGSADRRESCEAARREWSGWELSGLRAWWVGQPAQQVAGEVLAVLAL